MTSTLSPWRNLTGCSESKEQSYVVFLNAVTQGLHILDVSIYFKTMNCINNTLLEYVQDIERIKYFFLCFILFYCNNVLNAIKYALHSEKRYVLTLMRQFFINIIFVKPKFKFMLNLLPVDIVLAIYGILSLCHTRIWRQCVSGVKVRNSDYKSLSLTLASGSSVMSYLSND